MTEDTKDIQKTELGGDFNTPGYFRVFLQKKLEKITSAIHLVTNLIPEHEPLRLSLRSRSIDLLSLSFSIEGHTEILTRKIRELITLLQVARNANHISVMNYELLERELLLVLEQCSMSDLSESVITNEVFAVARQEVTASLPSPLISQVQENVSESKDVYLKTTIPSSIKDKTALRQMKDSDRSSDASLVSDKGVHKNGKKRARRDQIADIIKDKGEVNIKDIAYEIGGVSDKTIQRDLNLLIRKGIVEKHGERRWTTYKLVENGPFV